MHVCTSGRERAVAVEIIDSSEDKLPLQSLIYSCFCFDVAVLTLLTVLPFRQHVTSCRWSCVSRFSFCVLPFRHYVNQ